MIQKCHRRRMRGSGLWGSGNAAFLFAMTVLSASGCFILVTSSRTELPEFDETQLR